MLYTWQAFSHILRIAAPATNTRLYLDSAAGDDLRSQSQQKETVVANVRQGHCSYSSFR